MSDGVLFAAWLVFGIPQPPTNFGDELTEFRIAHWHRGRVADRDDNGNVIGNRLGVEGIDWHYELRWYPPTPVNADGGVAPAVRDLN